MRHSSASYAREQLEQKRRDRERAIALSTEAERRQRIEHERLAQEAIDFRWRALHLRKHETQQKYRDKATSLSWVPNVKEEAHSDGAEFRNEQAEATEALRTEERDLEETQHKLDEERLKRMIESHRVSYQIEAQDYQKRETETQRLKHQDGVLGSHEGEGMIQEVTPYKEEHNHQGEVHTRKKDTWSHQEDIQKDREDTQTGQEKIQKDREDTQTGQEEIQHEMEEGGTIHTEVLIRQLAERSRIEEALSKNQGALEEQGPQEQRRGQERRDQTQDEPKLRTQEPRDQKRRDQKQQLEQRLENNQRDDEGHGCGGLRVERFEGKFPGRGHLEHERVEDKRVEAERHRDRYLQNAQLENDEHDRKQSKEEGRWQEEEHYLDTTWKDKGAQRKLIEAGWISKRPREVNSERQMIAERSQGRDRPVDDTRFETEECKNNKTQGESAAQRMGEDSREPPASKVEVKDTTNIEELRSNEESQKDEAAAAKGKAEQESAGPSLGSLQRELDLMRDEAREQWLPSFLIQNTTSLPLHIGMFAYQKLPPALLNFQNNVQPGRTVKLTAPTFAGIYTLEFYIACGAESAFRRRALVLSSVTGPVERVTNYFVKYKASTFSIEAGRDLSPRQDHVYTLLRQAEVRRNVPLFTSSGWFLKGTRFLRFSGGPEMFHDEGRMVLRVTKNSQRFCITEMDSLTAQDVR